MGDRDDLDERNATRAYMVARLATVAPTYAYALRSPGHLTGLFFVTFGLATAIGVVAVAVVFGEHWRRVRPTQLMPLDVVFLAVLMATTGGAQSQLRHLLPAMMIVPALVVPPRVVAAAGLAVAVGYLASAVPDVLQGERHASGDAGSLVLALVWVTAAAAALSQVRTDAASHVAALQAGRRRLLGSLLDMEARQRRRITRDLHEGPLQFLLAARQDLEEGEAGDRHALASAQRGIAAAIDQLRDTIADVHPVALDHGGLTAALRAIAERAAVSGGFTARVEVDPSAEGARDDVLVNVARELVANVVEHAGAAELVVRAQLLDGTLTLAVIDDGVGFAADGLDEGAVGLASCAERVASAGGTFAVESTMGRGTTVRVRVPRTAVVAAPVR